MNDWVFGYGSLVAPHSVAQTIGRTPDRTDGWASARLGGYGRRWNYGSLRQRASWSDGSGVVDGGVVVSLGIAAAGDESVNGAVVRVAHHELERLDERESDYDRIDVTEVVSIDVRIGNRIENRIDGRIDGTVWTYLPRPSAIARYEEARAERRAAVRRGYVELVRRAFGELGPDELDVYLASTPTPDVPVVDFEAHWLEPAPRR